MNSRIRKHAFTLIELLVVIAIIGILASLVMVGVSAATKKQKEAKAAALISNLKTGLALFNSDTGTYPPDTHVINPAGIDPIDGLHSLNADSLLRYLNPRQARAKGIDPKTLGEKDYVDIPQGSLKLLKNKWVVIDPWDDPLIYDNNSDEMGGKPHYVYSLDTYDLYSAGPNKKDERGKGDDIPQTR